LFRCMYVLFEGIRIATKIERNSHLFWWSLFIVHWIFLNSISCNLSLCHGCFRESILILCNFSRITNFSIVRDELNLDENSMLWYDVIYLNEFEYIVYIVHVLNDFYYLITFKLIYDSRFEMRVEFMNALDCIFLPWQSRDRYEPLKLL
jgi:hypothetical protein